MNSQLVQHIMAGLAQNHRTWIEILINPVTKSEQPERIITITRFVNIFRNVFLVANLVQHVQHGLVRAAMRWSP